MVSGFYFRAVLRHAHAASMRLQLEETLGTFNGYFFVTLYLNAAVQRVSFGYVTRSSSFNDVRFRLHILHGQPNNYAQPGKEPSNYSTSTPLSCHEGCAIHKTVNAYVLCSTQN